MGLKSASRGAWAAALALACLSSTVLAFATPANQAVLNLFTNQKTISLEANELNPYGLAAITYSKGLLKQGNFLATNWNDVNNNPGQGHTILQVTPQGVTSTFATIDPKSPLIQSNCGTNGVGLTMALAILSKGYVIVGSTPIAIGSTTAGPGCLILLDTTGTVLDAHAANEMTTSGFMTGGGPWGMAVSEFNGGSQAYLFVSYVLGANAASTNTLTGAQGGMVVRYGLQVPGGNNKVNFWGAAPDVIASGFPTQPGNIGGGAVGPAGLALSTAYTGSQYPSALGQQQLFISNLLNSSIDVVPLSTSCFTLAGASPQCQQQAVAWGGLINQPIGIAVSPDGTIVGANGGIGTLFEVAPTAGANLQLANQLVDNTGMVGAGNLFNVLFHPNVPNTLFFNDDGANSFNTLSASSNGGKQHHGRKLIAKAMLLVTTRMLSGQP